MNYTIKATYKDGTTSEAKWCENFQECKRVFMCTVQNQMDEIEKLQMLEDDVLIFEHQNKKQKH